jgi:hypothetical protein
MEGIGMHATTRPTDSLSIQHSDEARRPTRVVRALTLLVLVGTAISAFFLLTEIGSANTLVVGPGGYSTISAAVQAASAGDTISVHAGTYREQVDLSGKSVTVQPYGDGTVTVDGQCQREHGFYIGSGTGQAIKGLTVTNTTGASILIENHVANVTIDGNTLQNFDCTWSGADPASWGQFRGGVAAWYPGSGITITDNTIRHRTSGEVRGSADPIWFKSNDSNPSGGGHYVAGNTIIGGWDGIGGEEEGSAHGTFDRDTIVENNVVQDTWDDCIQVEGGDANVRVRNNDLSGCGTGIAFAAPMSGPLYIENNTIHDLVTGLYDNHVCFKVGTNGQSNALTYMTGNSCDVHGGDEANGIHQSGGDNMTPIVARDNRYTIDGYAFYVADARGQDYDEDCFNKGTLTDNFAKWNNVYYASLASFQAGTGQEPNGREGPDCSAPSPTRTPTRTPTPTPTGTPTPTSTGTPTPTSTGTPTPTSPSGYTPGPMPTTAPGAPVPDESPLISAAMAPGWNYDCYVGESRPTEEALATAAGRVSAVYRPGAGGAFDRWFPNLPEISTLTTVNPGDTLFALTSDPFLWIQAASDIESTVDLVQGWNGVCYLGETGPVEAATLGVNVPYAVAYTLVGQAWQRFVLGRPELSNLGQLAKFTPVLILVTGENGRWDFNP